MRGNQRLPPEPPRLVRERNIYEKKSRRSRELLPHKKLFSLDLSTLFLRVGVKKEGLKIKSFLPQKWLKKGQKRAKKALFLRFLQKLQFDPFFYPLFRLNVQIWGPILMTKYYKSAKMSENGRNKGRNPPFLVTTFRKKGAAFTVKKGPKPEKVRQIG